MITKVNLTPERISVGQTATIGCIDDVYISVPARKHDVVKDKFGKEVHIVTFNQRELQWLINALRGELDKKRAALVY